MGASETSTAAVARTYSDAIRLLPIKISWRPTPQASYKHPVRKYGYNMQNNISLRNTTYLERFLSYQPNFYS